MCVYTRLSQCSTENFWRKDSLVLKHFGNRMIFIAYILNINSLYQELNFQTKNIRTTASMERKNRMIELPLVVGKSRPQRMWITCEITYKKNKTLACYDAGKGFVFQLLPKYTKVFSREGFEDKFIKIQIFCP